MTLENGEGIENTMPEESNILPEAKLEIEENGIVTIPKTRFSNLCEALKYIRSLENTAITKLRESNEYVSNEVKEMLENAFYGTWSDKYPDKENSNYKYSDSYLHDKRCYFDHPLIFLSKYEGDLSKFMDLIAQVLKDRSKGGWGNAFEIMCDRFGIKEDELLNMDTVSVINKMKKDIDNIPQLDKATGSSNMKETAGAGHYYSSIIIEALEKLGYNLFKKY